MALSRHAKRAYLLYLSKPAHDRPVYRIAHRHRVRRIVELGVGICRRAVRMIEAAALSAPVDQICYTGVDRFEARTAADGPGVTLKTAHRLLWATGARIRLLPGDPLTVLSRAANGLAGTDLVVISAGHDPDLLARAWFYLPRMLHGASQVLIEEASRQRNGTVIRPITADEIAGLATAASRRRAA